MTKRFPGKGRSDRAGDPERGHGKPARPDRRGGGSASDRRDARPASSGSTDLPFRPVGPDTVALYGFHPVREALRVRRRKLLNLFATQNAVVRLQFEIAEADVPVCLVDPTVLDARLGRDAVHQGLMLEARPLPALDVADVASDGGVVLVLDQITDPHNVGAILRTAAAFAVRGIILTERHAPALDGVLAKAASGALEHVPVATVVNLARALDELGAFGFHRIGLDSDGGQSLTTVVDTRQTALVLGAEGSGLRRLTRERCDAIARLDLPGAIRSLNVSNACAVALTLMKSGAGPENH